MDRKVMITVDLVNWKKFRKLVRSQGNFISYVMNKMIVEYIEENGGK